MATSFTVHPQHTPDYTNTLTPLTAGGIAKVVASSFKRVIAISCAVLPLTVYSFPILDQSYININEGSLGGLAIESGQSAFQTFTVGIGGSLSKVGVQIYQSPGTLGDVTLAINPTSNGVPILGAPLFSTQIPIASLPTFTSVPITIVNVPTGNINVTPGEQLAISLSRSGAGAPPWVIWVEQSGGPSYSGGSSYFLQDFGASAGSLILGSTDGIGYLLIFP